MSTNAMAQTLELEQPMIPNPIRIQKVAWENDDTFSLTLDMNTYDGEYQFLPGQFNMLYAYGIGEAAISISSDNENTKALIHTIHQVGIVTSALSQLKPGDEIGLRGPFGNSWPMDALKGRDIVVAAGGIGLAPLRPVLYHAFRKRNDYGRIIILYGARSPLDLLFRVELEQWSKLPGVEVFVTVDKGDYTWKGNIGVVTKLFSYVKLDIKNSIALVCGPEIMMKFTVAELDHVGVPLDQVYISMERNMKCGFGICGQCQYGPIFICKDGPIFQYPQLRSYLEQKEL